MSPSATVPLRDNSFVDEIGIGGVLVPDDAGAGNESVPATESGGGAPGTALLSAAFTPFTRPSPVGPCAIKTICAGALIAGITAFKDPWMASTSFMRGAASLGDRLDAQKL